MIVTSINKAYAAPGSLLDLFLESFRSGKGTAGLLDHLLIVSVDPGAHETCRSVHRHCYLLRPDNDDGAAPAVLFGAREDGPAVAPGAWRWRCAASGMASRPRTRVCGLWREGQAGSRAAYGRCLRTWQALRRDTRAAVERRVHEGARVCGRARSACSDAQRARG